ncbi:MAG TPA: Ig-like domain-containing protein, partial [Gammaproteobacteria bacterium]|nr:Ig-like domain-containing protein [Gammaproteobacteria bacterium]
TFAPSHVSWSSASADAPLSQQYVCGAAAAASGDQRDNDVQCFTLGGGPVSSLQSLIVAPVMTDMNTAGGDGPCPNCSSYGHDPKGNLDPTGQYFFWVSNMGGSRMDAFMVQVPTQVMGITADAGGSVTITSPKNGADITGALDVSASVGSGTQVAGVTFKVDGGSATTAIDAPYQASWPAGSLTPGTHKLTAEATDTNGHTTTSTPVTITVAGAAGGGVTPGASGGGGGGGSVSLVGLVAFCFFGLWRKLARQLDRLDAQSTGN